VALAAVANRTASVVAAETEGSQNHLTAHRGSMGALAAESAVIEIDQSLIRPTAASNHLRVAEAAAQV